MACALTRPVVHGLRPDYQSNVNFVVLDFDIKTQHDLAVEMGAARHPAFAVIPPNADPNDVAERRFGAINIEELQALLEDIVEIYSQAQ